MMDIDPAWAPFLRQIPLFSNLSDEARQLLHPLFQSITLKEGETLFTQGQAGNSLHLLISGQVQVMENRAGKEHVLSTLGRRGDFMGEMNLLGEVPRPGTAIARQNSVLMELNRDVFEETLGKHPPLALAVSRALAQRLIQSVHTSPLTRAPGKVYLAMGALPPQDRLKFILNLGLSTLEQTRRRVLMVEVTEENEVPAVSLLSRRTRGIPPNMDLEDFQSVEGIRSLTYEHPSGLDLISISESLLSGPLFGGLYPLVLTARKEWDFVFISHPGRSSRAARALWEEVDRTFYIRSESTEKGGALWREMESVVPAPRLDLVELQQESPPRRNRPGRFYIPWGPTGARGNDPADLFLSQRNDRTLRGLSRMARHLAGLRIGLAMGSGAALGYSIIGILKSLERHGIFPDLLAGTSMGALVGSFYAAGKPVAELEEIALHITKKRLWTLMDFSFPWKGVIIGNGVLRFLKSVLGNVSFDQLELPFACVATEVHSGTERVLRHGAVAEAVRASLSLPFFFEPFFWQGHYLVDGGVVNPVPTSVVQAMGADIALSVNITMAPAVKRLPSLRKRRPSVFNPLHGPSIFQVMAKTIYTMQYGIAQNGADGADVVIAPDLAEFGWSEFHRAKDIIAIGEEQAEKVMPKILAKFPFFTDQARRPLRPGT